MSVSDPFLEVTEMKNKCNRILELGWGERIGTTRPTEISIFCHSMYIWLHVGVFKIVPAADGSFH